MSQSDITDKSPKDVVKSAVKLAVDTVAASSFAANETRFSAVDLVNISSAFGLRPLFDNSISMSARLLDAFANPLR